MADLTPIIETLEHRWMRAWVHRDARVLKALTSRNFRMVMGTKPCVILDAASWRDAATSTFLCSSYRFGDIYVHDLGSVAVFATQLEIEATINRDEWSRQLWVTDVWRKSRIRRGWRIVDRVLSSIEDSPKLPPAIRSLQLWR